MNSLKTNYGLLIMLLLTAMFLNSSLKAQGTYKAEKIWETQKKFKVPESVYFDEQSEVIYVANINGKPTQKDDNGFISKMHKNGEIQELRWVSGLHAPKGMGKIDNRLFVTDIDRVAEIDVQNGKIIRFYRAENAKFLNDITVDDQGRVYVSDMMTGAVYRINGDSIGLWIPAGKIERSNGLNFQRGKIYLGASKKIYTLDPESKSMNKLADLHVSVDGLELNEHGDLIFSDWNGKVQLMVKGSGRKHVLFNTAPKKINAADIDYVKTTKTLLVPTFFDNRVVAYKVSRSE